MSEPSADSLPGVLKSFLNDVYSCGFPESMDAKIAADTKQALNAVLLNNLQAFDQTSGSAPEQAPLTESQQPAYNAVYDHEDVDPYAQVRGPPPVSQRQGELRQLQHTPRGRSEEQKPPQTATYRGRASYNLITGEADKFNDAPPASSPHRGKQMYNHGSASNNIMGGYSNRDTRFDHVEQGRPRTMLASRGKNSGNGVDEDEMWTQNKNGYARARARNQSSNIF
jgi:hypothetical protein